MAEWLSEVSVGRWYRTDGEPFEIVGIDLHGEIVLVQHYDGTLEDFDFDSWLGLAARPCAPPEDLAGAYDTARDDFGLEDELGGGGDQWRDPLDKLDQLGL
ncbi:hypothetical protein JN531_005180 [Flagellatimonas centrodinii]|uniref:DUF6763 family protein n=1 Tax=Flagellatimonas centrodinii TaxID=2806210 RepID=UPI001FED47D1|nr:DUF6763 family protein [Flagellatimonas centrodinii]ULQ47680.1 hypothetical protein JN531_005180 [Flagellatimonas centrodinii]